MPRALPFESGLDVPSFPLFYRGSTAIPRPRFKVQGLLWGIDGVADVAGDFYKAIGSVVIYIIYRKYMETTETMETYIY